MSDGVPCMLDLLAFGVLFFSADKLQNELPCIEVDHRTRFTVGQVLK